MKLFTLSPSLSSCSVNDGENNNICRNNLYLILFLLLLFTWSDHYLTLFKILLNSMSPSPFTLLFFPLIRMLKNYLLFGVRNTLKSALVPTYPHPAFPSPLPTHISNPGSMQLFAVLCAILVVFVCKMPEGPSVWHVDCSIEP